MLDAAAYAYPWDIVGDPVAPDVLAALGVDHVTVAAVYHATRTLTPRHPEHRVVVAEHTATYMPLVSSTWTTATLWPTAASWVAGDDSFGASAEALAAVGLGTHAWVVVDHVDPAGSDRQFSLLNAFDDHYPWALCPSHRDVREYAVNLAGETARRGDVSGIEFEAAGWYGFDHLHQHDKIAGIALDDDAQHLLSLCFCSACASMFRNAGVDRDHLRHVVRSTLHAAFANGAATSFPEPELLAAAVAARAAKADELREAIVREVRRHRPDPRFPIVFHGSPDVHRSTAFTGMDPSALPQGTTGVVVNCWQSPDNAVRTVKAARTGVRTYAGILGVRGMGADPDRARGIIADAHAAGVSGIRIYHAGLASDSDLAVIRDLVTFAHSR